MDYPKTRKEAQAAGATHYFTGIPCKHGHIAPRETKGNCVECRKVETANAKGTRKEYFEKWNKSERGKAVKHKHYEENKEAYIARATARDPEMHRVYKKAYKQRNPELYRLLTNTRRRRLRDCTPAWLSEEDRAKIKAIYAHAMQLTKDTGIKYTVDHIVPINGENVCGLHVPWNLIPLPHVDNARKGNRY